MTNDTPDERHPDDIKAEEEAIADAAIRIDEWFEAFKDELKATIQTYADGDAEDAWWRLREHFWTNSPLPKRKP